MPMSDGRDGLESSNENPTADLKDNAEKEVSSQPMEVVQEEQDLEQSCMSSNCFTCEVCGKKFNSIKSVSGHMRCHPERIWRGLHPPSKINSISLSTLPGSSENKINDKMVSAAEINESVLDRLRSLQNWPTERRGRQARAMNDANINVMQDGSNPMPMHMNSRVEKLEDFDCLKHDNGELESSKVISGLEIDNKKKKIESLTTAADNYGIDCKKKTVAGGVQYQCVICNKTFLSYQALGGHTASHNKERRESSMNSNELPNPRIHQCKLCPESFPSGQALGGHQRRHWKGPINGAARSIASSQTHETKSNNNLSKALEITMESQNNEGRINAGCRLFGFELIEPSNNPLTEVIKPHKTRSDFIKADETRSDLIKNVKANSECRIFGFDLNEANSGCRIFGFDLNQRPL